VATTKCSHCGEKVSTTEPLCPHCGAPADKIHKAAAGLEALVTLGDVVDEQRSAQRRASHRDPLARKFLQDCSHLPDYDLDELCENAMSGSWISIDIIANEYLSGEYVRRDTNVAEQWFRRALKCADNADEREITRLGLKKCAQMRSGRQTDTKW